MERAYLLAEIVSATDATGVPETQARWIDVKRLIYLSHGNCETVLIIEQDGMEVRADIRQGSEWSAQTWGPGDELRLPGFGLTCAVAELYAGTPLRKPNAG